MMNPMFGDVFFFFGVSIYCNIYCWMSVVNVGIELESIPWNTIMKDCIVFFLDVPKRPVLNLRGDWRLKEIGLLSPFVCI